MRLRYVKGSEEKIEKSPYTILDYKNYKGKVNKIFKNKNNILEIEIGMGKGDFIINKAKQNKNINFIGIEKYTSVLVRAVEKLEKESLDNLRILNIDANDIDEIFDKEVNLIYLNFSDPWPKEKHAKRRLTHINFLKKYDKIFKSNKHIIMKTDNRHLFEYSLISFINYGYKIINISLDLHKDEIFNIETEYENKFSKLGPIYMVEIIK